MTALSTIPTREEVPVEETWNVGTLYANDDAWEADVQRPLALRDDLIALRGGVGRSAATLAGALDTQAALSEVVERLYVYAMLRRDENTTDASALERFDRIAALATEIEAATAFLTPEILAIPEDQFDAYIADPALAVHRHNLHDLARNRPHVRSAEVETVLAAAGELARAPGSAFTALDNADLTSFGTLRDESGQEIALTKGRVLRILEGRDRAARREAAEKMSVAYTTHRHTLAALHSAAVRKDVFYARMRGYPSARDAALFGNNIPPAVYDALIDAVREATPAFERYLDLRRRVVGVDRLQPYDLNVPLADLSTGDIPYADAVTTVLDGLAPLGERYLTDLRQGLASRWVDVHETANKRSGGYNIGPFGGHPYILLNWSGTRRDVYTLAHEAGHAMHSYYSNRTQPYPTAHYTIFVAEVASTVNEVLITWHLLDQATQDAERFAVLGQFLDDVRGTIVRQTMFAEFERWTHAQVEAGAALSAESLTATWRQLYADYFPSVARDGHDGERGEVDIIGIEWARIPHFYRGFYVFQYATGLAAAIALARAIREEGQPAVERYLAFLQSGGSDYPIELLRRAGVDMTRPEPVRAALAEFAARVTDAARLFAAGAVPPHTQS